MHIAVIAGRFPAVSETFVLNQITGFLDAGHEVTIIAHAPTPGEAVHPEVTSRHLRRRTRYWSGPPWRCGDGEAGFLSLLQREGAKRFADAMVRLPAAAAASGEEKLSRLIERSARLCDLPSFEAILCHFGHQGRVAQALRDMRILRGPLATVYHGYDMSVFPQQNGSDCYRRLLAAGDLHLPISDYWADRLRRWGAPPEKIKVHHMGVDVGRFQMTPRRLEGPEIRVLSIGRLVQKKGITYGLEAFSRAALVNDRLRYTIVGDGPLRGDLERQAKDHGVADKVDFRGWCDRDEVHQALMNHHLLLAPSITADDGDMEGIPVVIMEAMATGMPVISTIHSGIPELVEHGKCGFLASEASVDELTRHLTELALAPQRWPDVGRAGRSIIEEEFDIRTLNRDLVKLFESRFGSSDTGDPS